MKQNPYTSRLSLLLSLFVLLSFSLGGCTFARAKINVQQFHQKMQLVEPGKTKAQELETIFGTPPNAILPLPEGEQIHLYTFGDSKTGGLNLILFQFQKTNGGFDSGYFMVDKDGIVEHKVVSTNSQEIPWQWWPFGE